MALRRDDTNNRTDVFVHDRQTGETTRVSVASDGTQGNYRSGGGAISDDGRLVVFFSDANNLVPGDTNSARDVFVHDRQTDETTRVSVASDGTQGNGLSFAYLKAISADGRFVVFLSDASNLVPGDTNNARDVLVHDRQTGETTKWRCRSPHWRSDFFYSRMRFSGVCCWTWYPYCESEH